MNCPKCGASNADTSSFCTACGGALGNRSQNSAGGVQALIGNLISLGSIAVAAWYAFHTWQQYKARPEFNPVCVNWKGTLTNMPDECKFPFTALLACVVLGYGGYRLGRYVASRR